ncbi:reverse transcriptase domain-containing protein [Tanacetum coccineum]
MPFGLKNAKATYQRLVDKAFQKQISRNMEVYVDDLVIKSRKEQEIIRDIEETFRTLKEINMKLNPKKYTFGVEEAEAAFKQMKKLIAKLPILTAPMEKEELIVYLAAAREAMSAMTRIPVKGQIMADFIVEQPEDDPLAAPMEVEEELPDPWKLFTDGSSCIDGFEAGLILTDLEGTEYALSFAHLTKQVLVEELNEKSINEAEVLAIVEEEGNTWMIAIYEYLTKETLPAERKKARAVWLKSRSMLLEKSMKDPAACMPDQGP